MPVMTGLQLIFEIYKRKLQVRNVILNTSQREEMIDLPEIRQVVKRAFPLSILVSRLSPRI